MEQKLSGQASDQPYQIVSRVVGEVSNHRTLAGRKVAIVSYEIEEKIGGRLYAHRVDVRSWVECSPDLDAESVELFLISRSDRVIDRTMKQATLKK